MLRASPTRADDVVTRMPRKRPSLASRAVPAHRLGAGPGLAAAALGLDRAHTGVDLLDPDSPIRLEPRRRG